MNNGSPQPSRPTRKNRPSVALLVRPCFDPSQSADLASDVWGQVFPPGSRSPDEWEGWGEMKRVSVLLGACALLVGLTVAGYASTITPYVVTVDQIGSNVVATGSGEFDLTGLSFYGATAGPAIIFPAYGIIQVAAGPGDSYTGVTGPNSFGQNVSFTANSNSGGFRRYFGGAQPSLCSLRVHFWDSPEQHVRV